MAKPLNPTLYGQLKKLFGKVRVSNAGEAMRSRYQRGLLSGKQELHIDHTGEYYMVCCPRCNDTRYRLYINHRWGVRDEMGRVNLWLAICYNEDCYAYHEKRAELFDHLQELPDSLAGAYVRKGVEISLEARKVELPGPITRLDKLPPDHPACTYLADRFYDPERLGRFYEVGYCASSVYWQARNRIIAPMYRDGDLVGWQARYIGDIDWKEANIVKWWSCPEMQRKSVMYNLEEAERYRTGVIVEGPGDVWGYGPMSTATLGGTMTLAQQKMFIRAFRHHSAVLMYDHDKMATKQTKKLIEALHGKFRNGFAAVTLPEGEDPGSLDRGFTRGFVREAAAEQGVKISHRKR